MDKISRLVGRDEFRSRVFFNADFCGSNGFAGDGLAGHLHLVRRGPVEFLHESRPPLRVGEPSLVFYPRGLNHRLHVPAGENARLLCATVHFESGNANLLVRAMPDLVCLPLGDAPGLATTAGQLFAEADAPETGQDVILDRLCDVLIVQLIRHKARCGSIAPGTLPGLADARLARALDAMHERPDVAWAVDALARIAGMSRSKFAAHFHAVVGMPPGEYLTHRRLAIARDLLRKGEPVKTVCQRVGYASQPAFSRMFAERTGLSPRAWIASLKRPVP